MAVPRLGASLMAVSPLMAVSGLSRRDPEIEPEIPAEDDEAVES